MVIQINNIKNLSKKNSVNKVFFVDHKYEILGLKKYLSIEEFRRISDLIITKDKKK